MRAPFALVVLLVTLCCPGASAPAMPAWSLSSRNDRRATTEGEAAAAAAALASHRRLQESAIQPLTAGEKALFASSHNVQRCAVGQDSLNWDDADQSAAASLAATCSYAKSAYVGLDNGGRGESLYAVSFHQPAAQAAAAAVGSFLAEGASWDCATNSCSGSCEHYRQAVWGDTETLGCAVAHCMSGSPFDGQGDAWTLVVCEYSPAGNGAASERPFDASSCSGASTCVDGAAADSAAVEAAITADPDAAAAEVCVSDGDAADRIDVLVLYTEEAADAVGSVHDLELKVQESVDEANEALANSAVDLTFNVTAIELAPPTLSQSGVASGGDLLQLLTDSVDVKARRDFWASDLVSLVAESADFEATTSWVLGTSSGEPDHGYSVVQSRSLGGQQYLMARALGHNLGCASDARHSSVPPVTEYGYGLRQLSLEPYFRTVMASGQDCPVGDGDGCPPLAYYSRHLLTPATCEETAATGSGSDHDACAAVDALDDSTACSAVMTAGTDDADDAGACTYSAAVFASHTFPAESEADEPVTLLIGSATADCARTIEEQQAAVAQYRIGDDDSCGSGSSGALTLTGIPAMPPRDCKNQCSFHGSCDYAAMVCRCRLPWIGDDCSQRRCPDGCTGRGSCDTASGVCKCHGGWTGASCSIKIENFCPNDCAGTVGGSCDPRTGHCQCDRSYTWSLATDHASDMSRCTSAGGTCWEGSDFSKVTAAPRVEHPIAEIGSISTLNARDQASDGRQGGAESSWQTVVLAEAYTNPVVIVSVPTDAEDTPAAARVRNIRYDADNCNGWCFEMRLQEMSCADDDMHLSEMVDYLVIESGQWESWESDRIFASVFQSNGAGAAPTYTPVEHDVDLTVVNPPTLYVNAGDIIRFPAPTSWGGDIWQVPDSTCDWSNSVDEYWTSSANLLASEDSAEAQQWTVPISPANSADYFFTTNSRLCQDEVVMVPCNDCASGMVQRIVAEPLERGCGTGGETGGGAAHEHPSHAQDRECCYGEEMLSHPDHSGLLQCGSGDGWVEVRYSFEMSTVPVVLSQVQTYEDKRAVIMRQKDVTTSGAKLRMQTDVESTAEAGVHEEELIGVVAFGTARSGRFNRRRFEASQTLVIGSSLASEIVFRTDFGSRPRLFAALQTTAESSAAAQLRMMAVEESVAQAREGDGGATGIPAPLLHDLTPGYDSRSASGDYHQSMPATTTQPSDNERLARRESRRAWAYLQPRSGSICDRSALKPCGGDGWGRGVVAAGLRPCGGGMCVSGSLALCEGPDPAVGSCAATVPGVDDAVCSDVDTATDDDTARANCESAGDCTYTHAMQLGADCATAFAAAGRAEAACPAGCTFVAETGSCPDDVPADETVGYVAFDVGTTGGGTLQAYSLWRSGPGEDGDCGVFAGPDACNQRGHMAPEQTDRSDCICDEGFFGSACEYATCPRGCSRRGSCQHLTTYRTNGNVKVAAGTCVCSDGYYGDGCQYVECPEACNGRGSCDANTGLCTCREPFLPPACAAGPCTPACQNGGTCDQIRGTCSCAPLFFGVACEIDASPSTEAESCGGVATDADTTPDCAAAFAAAGGTGAANCPQGCDYSGSDGTRGHENKVGRR